MKRIREVNLTFCLTVIVSLLASFFIGLIPGVSDSTVLMLLLNQALLLVPSLIYILRQGENPFKLLGIRKIRWINVPLLILLQFLLVPVVSCLNLISMLFSENVIAGTIEEVVGSAPMIVGIICVALVPCVVEEVIFRGVLYESGYRKVHPVKGMLMCGLLFGLLHMNINQFCYAFVLGAIYCIVLEVTDSLVSTMLMHFVLNANSVILSYALLGMSKWLEQIDPQLAAESAAVEVPTGAALFPILAVFLVLAAVSGVLAVMVMKVIAKNSGTYEHLKRLLHRPSPTTWEAEEVVQTEPMKIMTPSLVLGIILCVGMIGLLQFGII